MMIYSGAQLRQSLGGGEREGGGKKMGGGEIVSSDSFCCKDLFHICAAPASTVQELGDDSL